MASFRHGAISFHFLEKGRGVPFVFQHGLGGDVSQPFGLFDPPPGIRLIAFDCRAHGQTPLGDSSDLNFATFADDLRALLDHLELKQAVIGGISMGAGVALNFCVRHPARSLGMVLSRPAWLDRPLPDNLKVYQRIAKLIKTHGALEASQRWKASDEFQEIECYWPDTAESLLGQIWHPRAEETVEKLEYIPSDVPVNDVRAWSEIQIPALILANRKDPIHPFEYGRILAEAIPGAEFSELSPKADSREQHAKDTQHYIETFLQKHFNLTIVKSC